MARCASSACAWAGQARLAPGKAAISALPAMTLASSPACLASIALKYSSIVGVAQPSRRLDEGIEHRMQILQSLPSFTNVKL
jgi:hypothetical protein